MTLMQHAKRQTLTNVYLLRDSQLQQLRQQLDAQKVHGLRPADTSLW